ncbi:MAG: hypothetical protein H7X95_03750, partial [Deltaproteobacteria bacterium]|nr:hypothetical protein [Deltaproteobacteria bacterium]
AVGTGGAAGAGGQTATGGQSGRGTGGAAGSAATGGAGGGASNCPVVATPVMAARVARSGGYLGTLTAYSALYDVTCTTLQNCADACVNAGGTRDSCTTGSECIEGFVSEPNHCLPPTYWRYPLEALAQSPDEIGAAEQTLVVIAYQDPLVLTDFGLTIPTGATIRGIQFDVRRSADALQAIDHSIRILRDGQPVGADRRQNNPWSPTLAFISYGGPTDAWGTTWTPSDLQSSKFGLAVAARYTDVAGNARAYIDFVRVTVYYVPASCN